MSSRTGASRNKRGLITGANGFVGAAICRHLAAKGWLLRGSTRTQTATLPQGVERLVTGSIDAGTDWRSGLVGIDAVVHCAARVHILHEEAADPLAAFRKTNVEAASALMRQAVAAGVPRVVFVSSIGAAVAESQKQAATPYQKSKLEAEQALTEIAQGTETSLVVLRPPLIYGPGAPGNIRRLEKLVARGLPLPLASIKNRRSLLYIGNLTSAVEAALAVEGIPLLPLALCDGHDLSTSDLVRRIAQAMGKSPRLLPLPASLLHALGRLLGREAAVAAMTSSLTIDNEPIRKALGWSPPFSVDEGLKASFATSVRA